MRCNLSTSPKRHPRHTRTRGSSSLVDPHHDHQSTVLSSPPVVLSPPSVVMSARPSNPRHPLFSRVRASLAPAYLATFFIILHTMTNSSMLLLQHQHRYMAAATVAAGLCMYKYMPRIEWTRVRVRVRVRHVLVPCVLRACLSFQIWNQTSGPAARSSPRFCIIYHFCTEI